MTAPPAREAAQQATQQGQATLADVDLLHRLVAIPSVTGDEAAAVLFMQQQARADGLAVDEDAVGNFVATAGHGPVHVLFVGHIDTVPGHIPVRLEGHELWGRGSVDAKGPFAAAYCAARRIQADPGLAAALTFRVVGAVDEEGDSRGCKGLDTGAPAFILVGEPSGVHGVTLAYKGILRGRFQLERPRGHGAHPGATAVEQAIGFWGAVQATLELADRFETLQGHLLALDTRSDGLSDTVTGRFHIRIPPGEDPDDVEGRLRVLGERFDVIVTGDERMRPAQSSHRTPLTAAFLAAIRKHGGTPRLLRKTGTADFNLLAQRHSGVPIVAYGPGDAALDHTPDERIDVREFTQAIDILVAVLRTLASTAGRGGDRGKNA